ncbi:hypothetical protein QAD02_011322 [Eretmocerus hayati]|uniref:Uncharacterized protein n=1 Tax=Eretmocerus hayati TaxID=131215 RepID=A0ACC2NY57_9HYME|nr:hypothetical protein QAD02_011322 [Eretmocerus hayati]
MASENKEAGSRLETNPGEPEKAEYCVYCNAGPIRGSRVQCSNFGEVAHPSCSQRVELLQIMQKFMAEKLSLQVDEINRNTDEKVEEVMKTVQAIASRVDQLDHDVDEVLNRVTVLENLQQDECLELTERIISESQDRLMKAKNVIVLGFDESLEGDNFFNFVSDSLEDAPFALDNVSLADVQMMKYIPIYYDGSEEPQKIPVKNGLIRLRDLKTYISPDVTGLMVDDGEGFFCMSPKDDDEDKFIIESARYKYKAHIPPGKSAKGNLPVKTVEEHAKNKVLKVLKLIGGDDSEQGTSGAPEDETDKKKADKQGRSRKMCVLFKYRSHHGTDYVTQGEKEFYFNGKKEDYTLTSFIEHCLDLFKNESFYSFIFNSGIELGTKDNVVIKCFTIEQMIHGVAKIETAKFSKWCSLIYPGFKKTFSFSLLVTSRIHEQLIENDMYIPTSIVPKNNEVQKLKSHVPLLPSNKKIESHVPAPTPKQIIKKTSESPAPVLPLKQIHIKTPESLVDVHPTGFGTFNGCVPGAFRLDNFKKPEVPSRMRTLIHNSIKNAALPVPDRQALSQIDHDRLDSPRKNQQRILQDEAS